MDSPITRESRSVDESADGNGDTDNGLKTPGGSSPSKLRIVATEELPLEPVLLNQDVPPGSPFSLDSQECPQPFTD